MEIFILVIVCFLAGLITQKIEPKTVQWSSWINKLIINLIFPGIILATAPDIRFSSDSLFVAASPWVFGCLFFVPLCIWLSRKFDLSREEEAVLILLSILGNTAFLGIAMVRTFLGEASIPSAVLYDQLGSFLILATIGSIVIAVYSSQGKDGNHRLPAMTVLLRKIICFPPFMTLIISFLIPSTESLGVLIVPLKWLGALIIPLALIAIGLQIDFRVEARHRKIILMVLCLKMLVLPVLTLAAAKALGISNPQFNASVFQAAMPPMLTPAIMLIEARIAPKLAASVLGIGTISSFISLPAWAYLINNVF